LGEDWNWSCPRSKPPTTPIDIWLSGSRFGASSAGSRLSPSCTVAYGTIALWGSAPRGAHASGVCPRIRLSYSSGQCRASELFDCETRPLPTSLRLGFHFSIVYLACCYGSLAATSPAIGLFPGTSSKHCIAISTSSAHSESSKHSAGNTSLSPSLVTRWLIWTSRGSAPVSRSLQSILSIQGSQVLVELLSVLSNILYYVFLMIEDLVSHGFVVYKYFPVSICFCFLLGIVVFSR
jgi:hypothetical protein